ncbi:MAG TPA: 30S ribosomal protein S13 [Candidatus Omnitrophota bacterium]|nr:30S ribosomal protein S13 [Candidatus Omnitrophota bacterium]
MPRIFGVDIPREKRTEVALRYLYGIGPTLSLKILKEAGVDPNKRSKDLTDKEVAQITSVIQKSNIKVEGDLRREVQQNIKRLIDIKCYKGSRHIKGLPVRGQRTHTNARTRKGPRKTVGGLLKRPPAPK